MFSAGILQLVVFQQGSGLNCHFLTKRSQDVCPRQIFDITLLLYISGVGWYGLIYNRVHGGGDGTDTQDKHRYSLLTAVVGFVLTSGGFLYIPLSAYAQHSS